MSEISPPFLGVGGIGGGLSTGAVVFSLDDDDIAVARDDIFFSFKSLSGDFFRRTN